MFPRHGQNRMSVMDTVKQSPEDDPYLMIEPHEGLKFYTPVGLGPGLDTCGEGLAAFFNLGFGFVEARSSVTHWNSLGFCFAPHLCSSSTAFFVLTNTKVGPVGAGGAKPEMVLQNLERRDVSQQIAQLGLLGASVGGSREDLCLRELLEVGRYIKQEE